MLSLLVAGALGACGSSDLPEPTGKPMGSSPRHRNESTVPEPPADESGAEKVRSANQKPVLLGIVIEPLGVVTVRHDVIASVRGMDADGDSLEYRFTWTVNGKRADADGAVLPKEAFRPGDQIAISVVADDGRSESNPLHSQPFEVQNALPHITSLPGGLDEQGSFRYQLTIEDPDDDRGFRYRLLEAPSGMILDRLSGMLAWDPSNQQAGRHVVTLEVEDAAGGKATQSFDLDVELVAGSIPAAPAPSH